MWYLTFNRIQVKFEKGGYASFWKQVTAPDGHEILQITGFRLVT